MGPVFAVCVISQGLSYAQITLCGCVTVDLCRVLICEEIDNRIPYKIRSRDIWVPYAEVKNFICPYLAASFFAIFEYLTDL